MSDDETTDYTPIPISSESTSLDIDPVEIVTDLEAKEPDTSTMPGLDDGLSPELVKELDTITTGPPHHPSTRLSIAAEDPPELGMSDSAAIDEATYDSFNVEVDYEKANRLLKHIYTKIDEANREYGAPSVNELVLGLPQYDVLEPWAQAEHGQSLEHVLPVDVIVVPGPIIHVVIPNNRLYMDYLRDDDD